VDGSRQQTVTDLIRARLADGATAGSSPHSDGAKLGLAVEGGGMRGIVSGGMLLALRNLGILPAFDAFYGTSSGSVNLAYTVGGADWDGVAVYYDHLTAGFIRRHQRWKLNQPVLDMDYAFDEVMTRTVPIGWDRVRAAAQPVYAVLTDVDGARSELMDMRLMGDDAMAYLKAGAWMPLLAGRPPMVHGTRYIDGGLLCPDPVYAALSDRCTHVLVLNSSPQGSWPAMPAARPALRAVLNRWQHGLGDTYVASRMRWDRDRAVANFTHDVLLGGAYVRRVAAPAGAHHVSQFTHRRDALFDGVRVGYQTITDLFGDGSKRPYFSLTMI
jgi:predicted patatin/cPLA2 family phospholipase